MLYELSSASSLKSYDLPLRLVPPRGPFKACLIGESVPEPKGDAAAGRACQIRQRNISLLVSSSKARSP